MDERGKGCKQEKGRLEVLLRYFVLQRVSDLRLGSLATEAEARRKIVKHRSVCKIVRERVNFPLGLSPVMRRSITSPTLEYQFTIAFYSI